MLGQEKVTLLVPTLNEIDGMKRILPQVDHSLFDQILVVDGGSKDGSPEYATQCGYDVVRQKRAGMRQAYLEAYPLIRGDVVITFSPDGNSLPEYLPGLVAKMREGHDMVIVSRYKDWAKSEDDTFMTGLGNLAFTTLINMAGTFRYTDSMVIYRAYRKDLIPRIGLLEARSPWWERHIGRYVSWEPQMSVRTARLRVRIAEIPGNEPLRVAEQSRIRHYRVALSCLYAVIEDWVFWRPRKSALRRKRATRPISGRA